MGFGSCIYHLYVCDSVYPEFSVVLTTMFNCFFCSLSSISIFLFLYLLLTNPPSVLSPFNLLLLLIVSHNLLYTSLRPPFTHLSILYTLSCPYPFGAWLLFLLLTFTPSNVLILPLSLPVLISILIFSTSFHLFPFFCILSSHPSPSSISLQGKVAQTACMSACKHLSTSLMQMLLDTELKQISMGAIQQFNLDVIQCECEYK